MSQRRNYNLGLKQSVSLVYQDPVVVRGQSSAEQRALIAERLRCLRQAISAPGPLSDEVISQGLAVLALQEALDLHIAWTEAPRE